ncbi:hypothetical protein [Haloferax marisrubri]|uniref:hypothetical protein n=1 Tax=Haloferax marisrubri TaxID=1544719 RepID=UPI0011AFACC9|nr:hypothetical protein [Haloferax marisrubri]
MTIPKRKQLGFNPAKIDDTPRGTVILAEPQSAHQRFLQGIPQETKVLLRISDANTLLNRSETASTYYGDETTVITTTTVQDKYLSELTWERELELIKEFEPDYHIPCDYPVYKHDKEDQRRGHVRNCLEGTLWVGQHLSDVKTRIIPLVKGETPSERGLCYRVFDEINAEYVAVYGTQYFLSGKGFSPLLETLQAIASEASHLKIMLIGLQSPRLLEQAPPQVVAAAGQRWIRQVQLRDVPLSNSHRLFGEMDCAITDSLSEGQAPLSMWTGSAEVTA